jgi:hypothetical protein
VTPRPMAISGPASPRSKLEGLVARGFQVNRSDPEYLTGALFPFESGWALIRRQPSVSARSAATPTARCGIRSRGR